VGDEFLEDSPVWFEESPIPNDIVSTRFENLLVKPKTMIMQISKKLLLEDLN